MVSSVIEEACKEHVSKFIIQSHSTFNLQSQGSIPSPSTRYGDFRSHHHALDRLQSYKLLYKEQWATLYFKSLCKVDFVSPA